jgi:hypothetical protein
MYILQEKYDTHDTYVLTTNHTQQPFTLTQQSWMDPTALEKKGLPTTSLARLLTDPQVST